MDCGSGSTSVSVSGEWVGDKGSESMGGGTGSIGESDSDIGPPREARSSSVSGGVSFPSKSSPSEKSSSVSSSPSWFLVS